MIEAGWNFKKKGFFGERHKEDLTKSKLEVGLLPPSYVDDLNAGWRNCRAASCFMGGQDEYYSRVERLCRPEGYLFSRSLACRDYIRTSLTWLGICRYCTLLFFGRHLPSSVFRSIISRIFTPTGSLRASYGPVPTEQPHCVTHARAPISPADSAQDVDTVGADM